MDLTRLTIQSKVPQLQELINMAEASFEPCGGQKCRLKRTISGSPACCEGSILLAVSKFGRRFRS